MESMSGSTIGPSGRSAMKLRGIRARRRFRALVRLVIRNLFWLTMVDDDDLGDDVQKNIRLLTRTRKLSQSGLSFREIVSLNKHSEYRTREEKYHIYKFISKNKMFGMYPTKVKWKLAAVAFYRYYGPGRVIMREGDQPINMYVMISGKAVAHTKSYDPVLLKISQKELAVVKPGMLFGEVSIMHNISRTATCTTLTDCELLAISKEDFERVLKSTIWNQWQHMIGSLARFNYFDDWDAQAIREFCINARLKKYRPGEVILVDKVVKQPSAYLVLRGRCTVIENLLVESYYEWDGTKCYRLYSDDMPFPVHTYDKSTTAHVTKYKSQEQVSYFALLKQLKTMRAEMMKRASVATTKETRKSKADKYSLSSYATTVSHESISHLPSNVEIKSIRVCEYCELAVFSLGENMRRRTVVATEEVECLVVPRHVLFSHDHDFTWSKVHHYLKFRLPTTKDLFREFLRNRRWLEYRRKTVEEIVSRKKSAPCNTYYNVPYSIRVAENLWT